jgi:3-hydroxyisobutyrate dehydrogenase-like beta-hydroxyacid dehydrogenase
MEEIAFVGLGGMGSGMAQRLAEQFPLAVYDLDPERCQKIAGDRVRVADSLADAVRPGGILITMLPDDAAVAAVAIGADEDGASTGAAAHLGDGGIHLNMSTVSPDLARRLTGRYAEVGGSYVAAPVWGRPNMSGSGGLACALAGPAATFDRVRPILDHLAARVEVVGADPALANIAKIIGNLLVASAIEALGEGLALAEKQGLDATALASLMSETVFDCPVYRLYAPLVAAGQSIPPGFTVTLGLKDLRLAQASAAEVDLPLPIADLIESRLVTSVAVGRRDEDWSAFSWVAAENGGLERPKAAA